MLAKKSLILGNINNAPLIAPMVITTLVSGGATCAFGLPGIVSEIRRTTRTT
jgi:hypothetical protein